MPNNPYDAKDPLHYSGAETIRSWLRFLLNVVAIYFGTHWVTDSMVWAWFLSVLVVLLLYPSAESVVK